MASAEKKPVCINFEFPCRDCIQPIQFKDVPDCFVIGEKVVLKYSILKSYSTKSDDWIGLFKCNKENENAFEFVTFVWAQKRPSFKSRPLDRSVTFNLEEVEVGNNRCSGRF